MLKRLRRAWLGHILFRWRIPYSLWHQSIVSAPTLACLDRREQHRLRKLASRFLHEKTITGAGGLTVDLPMRVYIAAQACLLILNLDLDYFEGWREIIVYPGTFIVTHEEQDSAGITHHTRRTLGGEAWSHGPVVLSWAEVQPQAQPQDSDANVILHEFAHKLDMLNGAANGMPPLHAGMVRGHWTAALSQAYEDLSQQVEHSHPTAIDPYAAENPAEFFAVVTEVFFTQPARLQHFYPEVYEQLSIFYRQDPQSRMAGRGH